MEFGGAGGSGSGGDLNLDGEPGQHGMMGDNEDLAQIGIGGASQLGRPGKYGDNTINSDGPQGRVHGAGGGGGYSRAVGGGARPGGNGAAGVVIVDLYA